MSLCTYLPGIFVSFELEVFVTFDVHFVLARGGKLVFETLNVMAE